MNHAKCYIKSYPRPQFVRREWLSLDGEWNFAFDREDEGEDKRYYNGFKKQYDILVPFSYECEASGIDKQEMCKSVWYSRTVVLNSEQVKKRSVLNFDGVDYTAKVWINGGFAGIHSGGYARFSLDITHLIKEGENLIVVKAEDGFDLSQPRGKQRWESYNYGCWYVQTTGIWKNVWLEFTNRKAWLENVKITPCFDEYAFMLEFESRLKGEGYSLEISTEFKGYSISCMELVPNSEVIKTKVFLENKYIDNQIYFWSPYDPAVYDFTFTLKKDGEALDIVESYCGLRDFHAEGETLKLNGVSFFQKLLLYQGYWEKTDLTSPDEESIIRDIELIKQAGYNGIRVHQKVESDLFLYYADIMGLLIWCEMPSPHSFNERANARFAAEWQEIFRQTYNHPSIVTWVIYNESWGIREIAYNTEQQVFTEAMYKLTKAYDSMRPVISNDGWEHTLSDVLTIHNYEQNAEKLKKFYCDFDKIQDRNPQLPQRSPFVRGYRYEGQPVIFSEYGGCAFSSDTKNGWGYGLAVKDEEGFYERFGLLADTIKGFSYCAGYCYTQFTDVQQEKNGLFTIDRRCKLSIDRIREINDR